ncbi:MAG: nucleoside triphosphate pyrophosphohydrolase [Proteobacteria bacterium]|nr:nucleoside triphosphate pyrophosphohydrolase [Pseudomonadota bacterium]NDC23618.1 nucleoside triphosphate pyrophosphohydrolase [Pseudomonadota bacterium]NDD03747.1 nucleoside triphosphate pyrophosphohydrolase [Pseudomonadota bacterium]NDG26631.1 nucleoside triphosphate pyrophosphohydrolase [Pseudomonadota bacterium]
MALQKTQLKKYLPKGQEEIRFHHFKIIVNYVIAFPMRKKSKKTLKSRACPKLSHFLSVVHELRTKCPWDKKQTHQTLSKYMLEEAYEAAEAMNARDREALQEELGDVLLQVALHSEIANEKGWFDFEKVAEGVAQKMIRRHPHVFGDAEMKDYETHLKNWTKLKQQEKPKKKILEGVPRSLPALQVSQRYGEITSSVGFDWKSAQAVMGKVKEELNELQAEVRLKNSKSRMEEELGDLFFSLAQLARHLGLDAERSVRQSNIKFSKRFEKLESQLKKKGKTVSQCKPEELEAAWQLVKKS